MKEIILKIKQKLLDVEFMQLMTSLLLVALLSSLIYISSKVWLPILIIVVNALRPFFYGFIISYILSPIVKLVQKTGMKRGTAISLVLLSFVAIAIIFILVALPSILIELGTLLQLTFESLTRFVDYLKSSEFFGIQSALDQLNIQIFDYIDIPNLTRQITKIMTDSGITFINAAISLVTSSLSALVLLIITSYFLVHEEAVTRLIKKTSTAIHPNLPTYIKDADKEMRNYIKTFGLVMLSKLPQYMILFFIIGHRSWFLLGILNMVAVLIPYVGAILVNFISLLTALSQGTVQTIGTLGIIGWSSFIDEYLITPKIFGKNININPFVQLLAVVMSAALFGILGVIIALPLLLMIRSIHQTYRRLNHPQVPQI